jgi:site-specific DNA recombinase
MKRRQPKAPAPNETKRCAIYTRKSTSMGLEQEFNSLEAQREACAAYIQRQPGWVLVPERYDDGGFTGANLERPAFQRLLADLEAGKVDVVVVYKVDRLSRSLLDFAKVMERLNAAGASFVSVTQNFSTADAMGRLTLNMLMSFAEFEREMIAERTRDKMAAARRKGKWTGGPVPLGYEVRDRRLEVNELEAGVVREVFELYLQHGNMGQVARLLNERKLLPKSTRVKRGKTAPGWTKGAVGRVLRNPVYAGWMQSGGELFEGEQQALVERATWHRVQRILDGREKAVGTRGLNPAYVLRGLLRCGACGEAMTPGSTRRGQKEYRYCRCTTRDKQGKEACSVTALPAPAIEEYVVARIIDATGDGTLVAGARAALEKHLQVRRERLKQRRAELPARVAAASASVARYVEELTQVEGRAREAVAQRLEQESEHLAVLEGNLAEVERTLGALEDQRAEGEWVARALGDFARVWEVLTPPNRGRLLRALVEKVVVDERGEQVEVHLVNFDADPEIGAVAPGVEEQEAAA